MKYTEKLLWILDKDTEEYGYDEEKFRINIDFVHSLGLKCDCVGWCSIDLGDPKTEFYLEKITAFCKENGFRARGGTLAPVWIQGETGTVWGPGRSPIVPSVSIRRFTPPWSRIAPARLSRGISWIPRW